jgi:glyoxylase-like metal-dependent hydrolase (beta-lactamase superfamily II)
MKSSTFSAHLTAPLLVLALAPLALASCEGARVGLMKRGFASATGDYFGEHIVRFDTIAEHVYSYRDGFDRDLVIETKDGLVIVDPFNAGMATRLRAQLAQRFPNRPVTHLIYSHYHLDHASGGAALAPRAVIAHRRCPTYWADLGQQEIAPPTQLIEGDVELDLGGVPVRLLDLGRSHTDTLYAVYLPAQKVLYGADLVFVKAVAPVGHPDWYRPGLLRALDRLAALDFQAFVPSHFDAGTRGDFLEGRAFYEETRRLVHEAVGADGRRLTDDNARFATAVNGVYDTLQARYGAWRGGGPMLLMFVQRNFTGEFLGY